MREKHTQGRIVVTLPAHKVPYGIDIHSGPAKLPDQSGLRFREDPGGFHPLCLSFLLTPYELRIGHQPVHQL
ncbi:hypothetical protein STPA111741_13775 [Stenotrophomonas pavanii]|uniref:hypothetical protein n=1 Tax=Stenotrophomonas pavanii TaxID=487698 RepID=UPI00071017CB|nr:hypothetical protein [Stenotrophomonas pavanii]